MATNNKIRADLAQLQNEEKNFTNAYKDIETYSKSIKGIRDQLSDAWSGDAYKEYIKNFDFLYSQVLKVVNNARNFSEDLQQTIADYTDAENINKNLSTHLKANIIS